MSEAGDRLRRMAKCSRKVTSLFKIGPTRVRQFCRAEGPERILLDGTETSSCGPGFVPFASSGFGAWQRQESSGSCQADWDRKTDLIPGVRSAVFFQLRLRLSLQNTAKLLNSDSPTQLGTNFGGWSMVDWIVKSIPESSNCAGNNLADLQSIGT